MEIVLKETSLDEFSVKQHQWSHRTPIAPRKQTNRFRPRCRSDMFTENVPSVNEIARWLLNWSAKSISSALRFEINWCWSQTALLHITTNDRENFVWLSNTLILFEHSIDWSELSEIKSMTSANKAIDQYRKIEELIETLALTDLALNRVSPHSQKVFSLSTKALDLCKHKRGKSC